MKINYLSGKANPLITINGESFFLLCWATRGQLIDYKLRHV